MTERPAAKTPQQDDLSKLVEQTAQALQTVDRRLREVRDELSTVLAGVTTAYAHGFLGDPGASQRFAQLSAAAGGLPTQGQPFPGLAGGNAQSFAPWPTQSATPFGHAEPNAFQNAARGFEQNVSVRDLRDQPPSLRTPAVLLVDEGETFTVQVDLPGVRKDDMDITITERSLTIVAKSSPTLESGSLLLADRGPSLYRRTIILPSEIVTSQSKATLKDGVLTLRVPKREPSEGPKHLDVAYG